MERNIDSMGRIVIPSEFRKQLRISEGDLLDISLNGDSIVMTKVKITPVDTRRELFINVAEEKVNNIKERYPVGTIVECIEMVGETSPVPTGTKGVVNLVDDIGTIHVSWENGSGLGLIEDLDRFKIIK